MDSMKGKLDMSKEELEAFLKDPDWDTTRVRGLGKLLSETIHTCIFNSIIKITQKGYTKEAAEHAILHCGPFYGTKGNLESNIVERALISLEINKKHDDSSNYTFQDLNKLVDFMTLEMVTMLRDMKLPAVTTSPEVRSTTTSVSEAVWRLLMCDLNVLKAMKIELEAETETGPESESENQETRKKTDDTCTSSCKKLCSMATHKREAVIRQKSQNVTWLLEKPYRGRVKGLKKKISSLKDLNLVKKQLPSSSSSEQNKSICLRVKLTGEKKPKPQPAKTQYYHSNNISRDDEKETLKLESAAHLQVLRKELQSWGDWANSKVMQVTKQLSQDREEVNMLKAEKEEAKKVMEADNEAVEGNANKRLVETTLNLNTTNTELNVATSAIVKLQSEQARFKEELEMESTRSSLEAKRLEQQLIKEEEALKKSESFGPEKTALEEELKALRRQVGQKQRERERAKCLLTETEIRAAKEERETAKVVNKAESIKNERERVEALAMAEYEITKGKGDEELKKNETEKKRIEYEISTLKLEAQSKRIAAMKKSMNMDSSKRLEVFRNMSQKKMKKKKDRECVMCLNEEITIVFAPCGHKVLCKACNANHAERMNECPSCRTPIEKRIDARFAKS